MSHIAPAGTPLSLGDLAFGIGAGLSSRRISQSLETLLATRAARPRAWTLSSGRAGMMVLLQAMKRIAPPERRQVIVPGYTCYSVPAGVQRAGLEVKLCDIDPQTLSFREDALAKIDCSSVLCIVTANLYGIPNALTRIEEFARSNGIFMLDDAAQALGASYAGRPVGGFGDAGLYSFDKGKNITTLQGGAAVASPGPLCAALDAIIGGLPASSAIQTALYICKLPVYALLLHPGFYGITRRMSFLGLGQTPYETDYPVTKYSHALAGLATRLAARLDEINALRIANANRLRNSLMGARGIRLPEYPGHAAPVFARFPVFVEDPSRRDALIEALNAAGIGATRSYPEALVDVPEAGAAGASQDGARLVARTVVTLPTHAYCPENMAGHVRRVVDATL